MDCERPQSVEMNFKIDCSIKARPKRWWEVIDVDVKVRELKDQMPWIECFGDLAAETGFPQHAGTTNRAPSK